MIKTLVAEPTTLIREGLIALLSREADIELIAAVRSAEDVLPTARELKPDVALLADAFPGQDGPDQDGIPVARSLQATLHTCRCAILSHTRDPRHLERAVATDIDGYLIHDSPPEFLNAAIRQLAAGNKVIDPTLAFHAVGSKASPLTPREAEALRAAARGFSTTEIALQLCLSNGTVRNYLSRAITKVGARNRVDAIRIGYESGWL
jgi:two-component system, NarL family, response regulator DesR